MDHVDFVLIKQLPIVGKIDDTPEDVFKVGHVVRHVSGILSLRLGEGNVLGWRRKEILLGVFRRGRRRRRSCSSSASFRVGR